MGRNNKIGLYRLVRTVQRCSDKYQCPVCTYGDGPSVRLECADVLRKRSPTAQMYLFFDTFFTTIPLLELMEKEGRGYFDYKKYKIKTLLQ